MIIGFSDTALEELYLYGSTKDRKYKKLSKEVVKQYIKKGLKRYGSINNIDCCSLVLPMRTIS